MKSFSRAYGEPHSHIGILLVAAAAAVATATSRADVAVSAVCSESRVCVNDAVNVTWEIKQWGGEREVIWVAVHDMILNRTAAKFDVFQYGHGTDNPSSSSFELAQPAPQSLERLDSVIYCYEDGPYKVPEVRIVSITLLSSLELNLLIVAMENSPTRGATGTIYSKNAGSLAVTIVTGIISIMH